MMHGHAVHLRSFNSHYLAFSNTMKFIVLQLHFPCKKTRNKVILVLYIVFCAEYVSPVIGVLTSHFIYPGTIDTVFEYYTGYMNEFPAMD